MSEGLGDALPGGLAVAPPLPLPQALALGEALTRGEGETVA